MAVLTPNPNVDANSEQSANPSNVFITKKLQNKIQTDTLIRLIIYKMSSKVLMR